MVEKATQRTIQRLEQKILEADILEEKQVKAEELIKNTVVLKRILVKSNPSFYKRVRVQFLPELRAKYNFHLQFYLFAIAMAISYGLYYFWDHSISMTWFAVCALFICASMSMSGVAFKYLSLQKDFDKLIDSLSKPENKEDRDFFIANIQNNLFTKSTFTQEDFNLLFRDPYTKEAAIIRDGVMIEIQTFFQSYIESINN